MEEYPTIQETLFTKGEFSIDRADAERKDTPLRRDVLKYLTWRKANALCCVAIHHKGKYWGHIGAEYTDGATFGAPGLRLMHSAARMIELLIERSDSTRQLARSEYEKKMIFNWDYSAAKSLKELDFLLDGRVNTFSVAPVDLNILETTVSNLRKRGLEPGDYTLFLEDWHLREKNSFDENDKAWLDAIVSKTQELGLEYHDWYLHIYDEVFSDAFFSVAQAIKRHNPSVRIFSDHMGKVDELRRFSQVVDAWSPLEGTLPPFTSSYAAAWDFMRASGKPLYVYSCDSVAGLAPDNYRLMPYLAYLENLDGFSYWSVLASPDRAHPGKERWGITYLDAEQHRQPSRRWWQWRSGIEDYLLLQMVEESFGRLRAEKIASKVRDAWNTDAFAKTVAQARVEMLRLLSAGKRK